MQLYFDVGNTKIKIGLYDDKIVKNFSFDTSLTSEMILFFIYQNLSTNEIDNITDCVISSVVPSVNDKLVNVIKKLNTKISIFKVDQSLYSLVKMDIDDPTTLGQDLFIDLYSGINKYGYPTLIIDLGTATKVLCIRKDGVFDSVPIFAGIEVSAKSLISNAELLTSTDLKYGNICASSNTNICIANGTIYSHIGAIKGIVEQFEKELGYSCKCVVTGGAMSYIEKLIPSDYIVDKNLALDGLNLLYKNVLKEKKNERY